MSPTTPTRAAVLLKPAALTIALAVALATSPFQLTSDFSLDGASAYAKSDKSKGKGGSKSKGKNGSKGKSGSSNKGGSSSSAANSNRGGSDGGSSVASGKPKRNDWSKQGAQQYKAELAAWKGQRGKGQSAASQGKVEKAPKISAGTPNSLVRQYVLANSYKQGDVAKVLKSWNSLNRNEQAYMNNMDNLASLPGKQVAYIRESANAGALLSEFEELGGDPTTPPTEEDLAAAQATLEAQEALDQQAVIDAQAVLDAQSILDAESLIANSYTQDQIDAANAVISAYTGEDPQAIVDLAEADPQAVIDQYDAWTEYQTAETAAQDAFMEASVSYSGEYDEATMGEVRMHVDNIIEMGELDMMVADYDAASEEEVVAETDETITE